MIKSISSTLIVVFAVLQGFTQTVTIGSQVWCTNNLNVSVFRNGDTIPQAKTYIDWQLANELNQPAWCYYDNKKSNGKKYGKLYNGHAMSDPRGLAPDGFHIPSDEEWTQLTNATIDTTNSRVILNELNFNLTPGGYRYDGGDFNDLGKEAYWWSSTEYYSSNNAFLRFIDPTSESVNREMHGYDGGFSVRCIKN